MNLLPCWWTLPALLASVLVVDVALSVRPARFIRDCLHGVRFPEEWWWVLIVVKLTASVGLVAGIWVPGVGLAANAGVVVYFLCAVASHLRARALGAAFWVNCLGMLVFSCATLALSYFWSCRPI